MSDPERKQQKTGREAEVVGVRGSECVSAKVQLRQHRRRYQSNSVSKSNIENVNNEAYQLPEEGRSYENSGGMMMMMITIIHDFLNENM